MGIEALANSIGDQFVTAWTAPAPFIVAALLAIFVTALFFRERIEAKDATIEHKDSVIDDYKEKLSGATPDQARQQIEILRAQVERLSRQRSLTPDQKKKLTEAAVGKSFPGSQIEIIYVPTAHETMVFATEIAKALQDAGWPVRADYTLGGGGDRLDRRGVSLAVHNMQKRSEMVLNLGAALDHAGIPFQWEEEQNLQSSGRLYVDLAG